MAHVRNTQTHEAKAVELPTLGLLVAPGETVEVPDDAAPGLCTSGYFEPADKRTGTLVDRAAKKQAEIEAAAVAEPVEPLEEETTTDTADTEDATS